MDAMSASSSALGEDDRGELRQLDKLHAALERQDLEAVDVLLQAASLAPGEREAVEQERAKIARRHRRAAYEKLQAAGETGLAKEVAERLRRVMKNQRVLSTPVAEALRAARSARAPPPRPRPPVTRAPPRCNRPA